ncbi:MAG TPA: hypothetical protein VK988_02620 [Acidimicrobiales bacterium]|nr:hypothetical protein [Acidimicrobiales bacterium]
MGNPAAPRYDVQPLLELYGGNISLLAREAGVESRSVHRWIAEGGVPEPSADRAAIRMGKHPGDIWDEWWDLAQGDLCYEATPAGEAYLTGAAEADDMVSA